MDSSKIKLVSIKATIDEVLSLPFQNNLLTEAFKISFLIQKNVSRY
jgi:hypothetical protein